MIYDGPKNGTRLDPPPAPFSIRVARLLESTDPEAGRGALEIVLTNTSKDFIEIPASPEVAALLDTPAPLRRVLSFGVCVNPCGVDDIIGNVEAGSNGDHAESIVGLRPGASMTFKFRSISAPPPVKCQPAVGPSPNYLYLRASSTSRLIRRASSCKEWVKQYIQ